MTPGRFVDTEVVIVGAGPVGLTLAVDLGRRGVRCILIEQKDAPQFLPKMERCNARTMEIYRRMGLAQKIRDAGFPRNAPMDVFIVTSLVEPPLLHLPYPSVAQAQAEIAACTDGSFRNIRSSRCSSRWQSACRASMSAMGANSSCSSRITPACARR
jgi:2-polyprenyl-6-methoxyphenol hydroxylase-like FAD-dependent oxidoreductase